VPVLTVPPHARHERADTVDHAVNVDIDDPVPIRAWYLVEPHAQHGHAGVVAHDVDGPEPSLDGGSGFFQHRRIGDVGHERFDPSAEIVEPRARVGQRIRANIDHGDIGPGLRERRCHAKPYSRCRTRHVCGLPLDIAHAFAPCRHSLMPRMRRGHR
jgi:hypothetical protein